MSVVHLILTALLEEEFLLKRKTKMTHLRSYSLISGTNILIKGLGTWKSFLLADLPS